MSEQLHHRALDSQLEKFCEAPRWWVGFSGGLDSTVLLHLLQRWCRANPGAPALHAVHVHHGLQDQADDWLVHCEWMCKFLQTPLASRHVNLEQGGRGLEAAAREARYRVFEDILEPGELLFLAHHLDDQVETFMLRLMRGAGVHGLAAMPAQRPLAAGTLARPLLEQPRRALAAYAEEHGLQYIDDPSNEDASLDRNYIRREVLPLLEERWPGYRRTVVRASAHLGRAAAQLQADVELPATLFSVTGDPGIEDTLLRDSDQEQAAQVLRGWLRCGAYPAPDQASLLEFLRQLRDSGATASPRLQCREFVLQRFRGAVYLLPRSLGEVAQLPAGLQLRPGQQLDVPGVGLLALQPCTANGLLLAGDETLQLRYRSGGERCQPVGRSAANSLKKLLQEAALPHWWRDRVPLLYLEDELLAVGGLGPCQGSRWRSAPAAGECLWQLHWQPPVAGGFD